MNKFYSLTTTLILFFTLSFFNLKGQEIPADTTMFTGGRLPKIRSLSVAEWLTGSDYLYTDPSINVGIGTSVVDSKLNIDFGTVGTYSGHSGRAIRTLGNVANSTYLDASTDIRLNTISYWTSQAQVRGIYSKVKLKRSASTSYANINSGGLFITELNNYTHNGSKESVTAGVYGYLSGTISSHPSDGKISAVFGRDLIKDGKTWAGYFDGRGHFTGNLGIGTTNPEAKLHIKQSSNEVGLIIDRVTGSPSITSTGINGDGNIVIDAYTNGTNITGDVYLGLYNDRNVSVGQGGGSLCIGHDDPKAKLDVIGDAIISGKVTTSEIIVEANGNTAEFVFEDNYQLKDLSEVETFIKANKHLPEIPSADEMEQAGVNLAEMNKLLLMKVEELTLYLIEMEKQLKDLQECRSLTIVQ